MKYVTNECITNFDINEVLRKKMHSNFNYLAARTLSEGRRPGA